MLAGFLLGPRHHDRESKAELFCRKLLPFCEKKMAQQHQQWIFLEICDQNSRDFKKIKLKEPDLYLRL
jgi:hypothetical protein